MYAVKRLTLVSSRSLWAQEMVDPSINNSFSLSFIDPFRIGASEIEIVGFEPQVNQRLLPPTFPRYTQIRSRAEAITNLIQLMDRLKAMCKIKDHTNFHAALVKHVIHSS